MSKHTMTVGEKYRRTLNYLEAVLTVAEPHMQDDDLRLDAISRIHLVRGIAEYLPERGLVDRCDKLLSLGIAGAAIAKATNGGES